MNFVIEKEDFLNNLKIVEKASIQNAVQPVLSNILLEAEGNSVKFTATDSDFSIASSAKAQVKKDGSITLPAKTLLEIASKIPNKPVKFELNTENQIVNISCGSAQFDVIGISAAEFPVNFEKMKDAEGFSEIQIEAEPFISAVKKTVFAAANSETKNIISGVFCSISEGELEMAATDGNRLAQVIEKATAKIKEQTSVVLTTRCLLEIQRIAGLGDFKNIEIYLGEDKVLFKLGDTYIKSIILKGTYPPYKQLIPANYEKKLVAKREEVINALERVSIMISEKMNIVKLKLSDNKLYLSANTPSEGKSEDTLDVKYDYEEMTIAFNYRYIVDCLKVMETENVVVGLNGSLSASVFRPENEDNYLCLIMPIQIR